MKLLRDIIQGAGYLEDYGHHPGTDIMIVFILMGGLAGAARGGLWGFIGGCALLAVFFVPLWCVGCVNRARSYQEYKKRNT